VVERHFAFWFSGQINFRLMWRCLCRSTNDRIGAPAPPKDGLETKLNLSRGIRGGNDHSGRGADLGTGKDIKAAGKIEVRVVQ